MEITSLPTESLYKFMAFAGLLIIYVTAAYVYKYASEINADLISLEVYVSSYAKKSELWTDLEEVRRLNNVVASGDILIKGATIEEVKERMTFDKQQQEKYMSQYEKLFHERLDLETTGIEIAGKVKLISFKQKQLFALKIGCAISIIAGITLTWYGFHHWAIMQGYVDKSLIKEASKH